MNATRTDGPPRLAEWLLARCLRPDDRPMILGDLDEQFRARVQTAGRARATRWYWRDAARLAWGLWWWTPRPARHRGTVLAWDDARYAGRRLWKQPVASAVSVATLACAIGAAAATWSLLSAVLLNPLHLPYPERLVDVDHRYDTPRGPRTTDGYTYPEYVALRDAAPMPIAAWGSIGSPTPLLVQTTGAGVRRSIRFASYDFLDVLGVHPSIGRFFLRDEDRPGGPLVAVLSDRFWRGEFQADRSVIGRVIHVRDLPVTIVGVGPRGFRGLEVDSSPDLFMPLHTIDRIQLWDGLYGDHPPVWWVQLVGRLPEGVIRVQMAARLDGLRLDLGRPTTFVLTDVRTASIPESARADVRQFSLLLGTTVALLLAIGSLTVGMLLVLRTEARSGELAMCRALGASRARLAAGVLVEGVLLAAAGAVLALPVSRVLFNGIRLFKLPGDIGVDVLDLSLDGRVLAGAAGAALAAVLLMTALVSLFGIRREPGDVLRSHAGGTPRLARRRSRSALVTAQVAVTLVLVTGAGLFARSITRALSLDPGIDISRLISTSLHLQGYGYDAPRAAAFYDVLRARLALEPAILSIGLEQNPFSTGHMQIDGELRDLPSGVNEVFVDQAYFRTIGLPVSAGRAFTAADRAGAPPVAIVNPALARLVAGTGNPIGHQIGAVFSKNSPIGDLGTAEIVGVVPDVVWGVWGADHEPGLELYQPLAQHTMPTYQGSGGLDLWVHSRDDVPAAMAAVTAAVRALDPQVHLQPMTTIESNFLDDMAPQRFGMTVLGALGAIALLLSLLGAYVMAESMATLRRREMGIRAALGAPGSRLRMLLLSETFRQVGAGLLFGFVISWLGAGTIRAFLFEVEPFDPLVTVGVATLIIGLTLVVSLRPALAAARVDFARVLHED